MPYAIPSPSGAAIALKRYWPDRADGLYDIWVKTDAQMAQPRTIRVLDGPNLQGERGEDGLIVGWTGDHHLTIGWPIGFPILPGPTRIRDIGISYLNYEPDLAKAAPQPVDEIILHDVQYTFGETQPNPGRIDCGIHMTGKDGEVFEGVDLEIVGHGLGTQRKPGQGPGSISVEFGLVERPDGKSPPVTPTQAKIENIFPFPNTAGRWSGSPIQRGMTLRYGGYYRSATLELLELIRKGNYHVQFSLTFGERVLSYSVSQGMPSAVAEAYQRCDARTNVFTQPSLGQ